RGIVCRVERRTLVCPAEWRSANHLLLPGIVPGRVLAAAESFAGCAARAVARIARAEAGVPRPAGVSVRAARASPPPARHEAASHGADSRDAVYGHDGPTRVAGTHLPAVGGVSGESQRLALGVLGGQDRAGDAHRLSRRAGPRVDGRGEGHCRADPLHLDWERRRVPVGADRPAPALPGMPPAAGAPRADRAALANLSRVVRD